MDKDQKCSTCMHRYLNDDIEPCVRCKNTAVEGSTEQSRRLFLWKPMTDNVNHPNHYETGKFECIDVMVETQGVEAVKEFCICNAFKYLYRHKNKNGNEDIKKAVWYLNKYFELEDEE